MHARLVLRGLLLACLLTHCGCCSPSAATIDAGADIYGAWPLSEGYVVTVTEEEIRVWKTQARQNLEMLTKLGVMPQSEFNRLQEWLMRSPNLDQFYSEIKPVSGEFKRLNEQLDNGTHQVVDNEDIMLELLNDGWELVRELNGSKFLMKKP